MVKSLAAVIPLGFLVAATAAQPARAPEQEVRSAVRRVYRAMARGNAGELAAQFTANAELRIRGRLVAAGPSAIEAALLARPAWSEVSPPLLERISVRLFSPDTAVVDAQQVEYGSLVVRRSAPVLLLLSRSGAGWQVASMRIMSAWPGPATLCIPVRSPNLP